MTEEILEKIKYEENELKKILLFMAWLNRKLKEKGIKKFPILVGGSAVELYTFGYYASGDIDLVFPKPEEIKSILLSTGLFRSEGRIMVSEELGLFVDIPDTILAGSYEKVRTIEIPELSESIVVIGVEDLIVDRLNACVFWKSQGDCEIATYLYEKYKEHIDLSYLIQRLKEEQVPLDKVEFLKGEIGDEPKDSPEP
ncbi:MAG: hypothetical protein ACPLRS_02595 [Hydrogenobacter sp.]